MYTFVYTNIILYVYYLYIKYVLFNNRHTLSFYIYLYIYIKIYLYFPFCIPGLCKVACLWHIQITNPYIFSTSNLTFLTSSHGVLCILLELWASARFLYTTCHRLGEAVALGIALIFVNRFVDKHFSDRTDCQRSVSLPSVNLHAFKISAPLLCCISLAWAN